MIEEIISGRLSDDRVRALLTTLTPKSLSAIEIADCAQVMRNHAQRVAVEDVGDTCGTGGDTLRTFNVSTTAMFILAAGGVRIAKHGNRAVTSQCGSADVLEALGVKIEMSAGRVAECINKVGIGFIYAPLFHQVFQNVQKIRKTLAQRTIFNILGPLANPASPSWQILGVYSEDLVGKIAETLRILKVERAIVAHGRCDGSVKGLDEFSTVGRTIYAELIGGKIELKSITPEDVGLPRCHSAAELKGGDKERNAKILREILSGTERGPKFNLVLLNAGAGLYVGGGALSIQAGVKLAREIVESGKAMEKFQQFRGLTLEISI